MTLDGLPIGETATIQSVKGESSFRRRLYQMGLSPGQRVTILGLAPMGSAIRIGVNRCTLALGRETAEKIQLGWAEETALPLKRLPIPGGSAPLPENSALHFALVGNQNCGKTTLFNRITGGNQKVGNFPGVTVERKDGRVRYTERDTITDLPGVYSLEAYSPEERVTRAYLSGGEAHCIINIVDATNLERGLKLTLQLLELARPMVVALNMMDEVTGCGGTIDTALLEKELGVSVVPISAAKGKGVPALLHTAFETAKGGRRPRFYYGEGERERAQFVRQLCERAVHLPERPRPYARSVLLDRLLSGRWTGLPLLCLVMGLIFWLTFQRVGPYLSARLESLLAMGSGLLEARLVRWQVAPVLRDLLLNGVCRGVGSVLAFLPVIITLFVFLSLLEDSGYMARVAFLLDGPFRRLGLSGKSAVPLILGFGCTVPAVMACRILPGDRKTTIQLTPFISCTAKLPIYGLLAGAFFPGKTVPVVGALYLFGIACGLVSAVVHKSKTPMEPLLLELPNYRLPTLKSTMLLLGQKAWDFTERAFTVIFLASLLLWLLRGFNWRLRMVTGPEESMLAALAGWLVPLFRPLGLGDWRLVTALLTGLLAKESVVSTLAVLFGSVGTLQNTLSQSGAACLLVFTLLYSPCAAALAAVRRELGTGEAVKLAVSQALLAWGAALMVKLFLI